jgi:hypothetical protein
MSNIFNVLAKSNHIELMMNGVTYKLTVKEATALKYQIYNEVGELSRHKEAK